MRFWFPLALLTLTACNKASEDTPPAIDDTYVRIDAPYATCSFDQDWTAGSSTGAAE